jgi:hypothetical protein
VDSVVLSGTGAIVPSGTRPSCYREPESVVSHERKSEIRALNLESNQDSNLLVVGGGKTRSEPRPAGKEKGRYRDGGERPPVEAVAPTHPFVAKPGGAS